MRRGLMMLALLIVTMVASARESVKDVVELKNGEKIECTIVSIGEDQAVTVRLRDGQEMTFSAEVVSRVLPNNIKEIEKEKDMERLKRRKMVLHTGLSFAVAPEANAGECRHRGVNLQTNWRPVKGLSTGVGVMPSTMKCRTVTDGPFRFEERFFAMPFYGTAKFDFVHRDVSPFVELRAGGVLIDMSNLKGEDKVSVGGYLHFGIGVRVALRRVALCPYAGMGYVGERSFELYGEKPDEGGLFSLGFMVEL